MIKEPKSANERKRESRARKRRLGLTEFIVTIPDTVEAKETVRKTADELRQKFVESPGSRCKEEIAARESDIGSNYSIKFENDLILMKALEESKRNIDRQVQRIGSVIKEDE